MLIAIVKTSGKLILKTKIEEVKKKKQLIKYFIVVISSELKKMKKIQRKRKF